MTTILFMFFFGRWGKSEMNWFGNSFVRERIEKREKKWVPILVILDCVFLYLLNK